MSHIFPNFFKYYSPKALFWSSNLGWIHLPPLSTSPSEYTVNPSFRSWPKNPVHRSATSDKPVTLFTFITPGPCDEKRSRNHAKRGTILSRFRRCFGSHFVKCNQAFSRVCTLLRSSASNGNRLRFFSLFLQVLLMTDPYIKCLKTARRLIQLR